MLVSLLWWNAQNDEVWTYSTIHTWCLYHCCDDVHRMMKYGLTVPYLPDVCIIAVVKCTEWWSIVLQYHTYLMLVSLLWWNAQNDEVWSYSTIPTWCLYHCCDEMHRMMKYSLTVPYLLDACIIAVVKCTEWWSMVLQYHTYLMFVSLLWWCAQNDEVWSYSTIPTWCLYHCCDDVHRMMKYGLTVPYLLDACIIAVMMCTEWWSMVLQYHTYLMLVSLLWWNAQNDEVWSYSTIPTWCLYHCCDDVHRMMKYGLTVPYLLDTCIIAVVKCTEWWSMVLQYHTYLMLVSLLWWCAQNDEVWSYSTIPTWCLYHCCDDVHRMMKYGLTVPYLLDACTIAVMMCTEWWSMVLQCRTYLMLSQSVNEPIFM